MTRPALLDARIRDAAATVLPGCGHAVHEDCADRAIPALGEFLR